MERPKRKSTEGVAVATKKLTKRSRRQGGTNPSAHQAVGHQVEKQAICNHIEQPAVNDQGEKQAMGDQDGEQAVDDEMEMPRCAKCSKSDGTGRRCTTCQRPLHHFCSLDILAQLQLRDDNDMILDDFPNDNHYCSTKCYYNDCFESAPTPTTAITPPKHPKLKVSRNMKGKMDKNSKDPLFGAMVAFSPLNEPWMSTKEYKKVGPAVLIGRITKIIQTKNKPQEYELQWSHTEFQGSKFIHRIAKDIVEKVVVNYTVQLGGVLNNISWKNLCENNLDMQNDDFQLEDDDDDDLELELYNPKARDASGKGDDESRPGEVEQIGNMSFHPHLHLSAPTDMYKNVNGSTEPYLKPEYKAIAAHSAASCFFLYLPLSFWEMVVHETNLYTESLKQKAITMDELMCFLGILFYMELVKKGEYQNYWGEQVEDVIFRSFRTSSAAPPVGIGLDDVMSLRRFKHIRSSLCFNASITPEKIQRDPACRIRPLINILKARSTMFVEVGRNVAVDEASVACRSKFARHMILYNPKKPTGKYHFKIYTACDSSCWLAFSFKLHCHSDLESRLQGIYDEESIAEFKKNHQGLSDIRLLLSELVEPIINTKRVVNTDNYYTSTQLLELLRLKGLYGRGTVRKQSAHFPRCIQLTKAQAERGEGAQAVCGEYGIVAASWADASVVNIVSNADGVETTNVGRQIGKEIKNVEAPTCILEYNKAMQGVDRMDQLRARFSLADGHSFKKWYRKMAMAFIDIARVNAYVTRKLAVPMDLSDRDHHRMFVTELTISLINGGWKSSINEKKMMYAPPIFAGVSSRDVIATSPSSKSHFCSSGLNADSQRCTFEKSKDVFETSEHKQRKSKRYCVICRLEGRKPTTDTVFCFNHQVSLCQRKHKFQSKNSTAACTEEWTCVDKFHKHYQGIYNAYTPTGKIRKTGVVFKEIWPGYAYAESLKLSSKQQSTKY